MFRTKYHISETKDFQELLLLPLERARDFVGKKGKALVKKGPRRPSMFKILGEFT